MSTFTLGNITFNSLFSSFSNSSELIKGKYGYNILKYPDDLGAMDKGHYIIIHINAQRKTQFEKRESSSDLPTIYDNKLQSGNLGIGGALSTTGGAIDDFFGGAIGDITQTNLNQSGILPIDNPAAFTLGFTRTIYRTTDTIALYMPDTVAFQQGQAYSEFSPIDSALGRTLVGGLLAGASYIDMYQQGKESSEIIKNLSPFIANRLSANLPGSLSTIGFAAVTGLVQNPMLELIYTSPIFRTFQFDFMFYPKSESEALQVQNILERLRFHQSPEIYKDSYGFFLVPPSEFDIKFYYNGYENENIPKISTCVMESLDIDYAPDGFSAYEVPNATTPFLGGTGMPVGIKLRMMFKETEYLTKENYKQV